MNEIDDLYNSAKMKICSPQEGELSVDPITLRVTSNDLVSNLQRYVCMTYRKNVVNLASYMSPYMVSLVPTPPPPQRFVRFAPCSVSLDEIYLNLNTDNCTFFSRKRR